MSEKVVAYSLRVVPRIIDPRNITRLHDTGMEEASFFAERTNAFFQRPYDKTYIANWDAMKKADLPVVQDLLINPKRGFMLLTDVKADGKLPIIFN